MRETTIIIGCGYLGKALGRRLLEAAAARGEAARVFGSTTTPARLDELRAAGIEPVLLALDDRERLRELLRGADSVFLTVAPGRSGRSYRETYRGGVERVLAALEGSGARAAVFTSSSAVYAQDDGQWVDEDSPAEPVSENGRALLDAERLFLDGTRALGVAGTVLRLTGLWSADRGPQRAALDWAGKERQDGDAYLNLVHRDDVVEAMALLERRPYAGILNLNDDAPTTRREYYDRILAAAGLSPIRWAAPAGPVSRGKRVKNARAKEVLGWGLGYPGH
jgi:nucleoside-diphosphate-sugar epimerase